MAATPVTSTDDNPDIADNAGAAELAEHVDVLIVGAGISGIGGAYHLQQQCPDKSYVILEAQADYGGTWRTHTYPGIRSDSDLFTFGYRFKPWTGAPIATAEEILKYLGEVIEENDIGSHIHYGHQYQHRCSWSTARTIAGSLRPHAQSRAAAETVTFTCELPVDVPGILPTMKNPTPRTWPGHGSVRRGCSSTPSYVDPDDLDYTRQAHPGDRAQVQRPPP